MAKRWKTWIKEECCKGLRGETWKIVVRKISSKCNLIFFFFWLFLLVLLCAFITPSKRQTTFMATFSSQVSKSNQKRHIVVTLIKLQINSDWSSPLEWTVLDRPNWSDSFSSLTFYWHHAESNWGRGVSVTQTRWATRSWTNNSPLSPPFFHSLSQSHWLNEILNYESKWHKSDLFGQFYIDCKNLIPCHLA